MKLAGSRSKSLTLALRPSELQRWRNAAGDEHESLSGFIRHAVEEHIVRKDLGLALDGGPPDPKELAAAYERLIGGGDPRWEDEVLLEWTEGTL